MNPLFRCSTSRITVARCGNHGGRRPERKRLLVSLGTVKPMVDGLDLIARVMDSASEVDAEIILHISANARSDLRSLPSNVRPVDWIPMGVFLNGADGFIHHGGAGNTLTALHAGIPQIVFGREPIAR